MLREALFFLLGVAAVVAVPSPAPTKSAEKIVGGELTTIDQYPYAVSMLNSLTGLVYIQACGGTILNNRSILSAAHCFILYRWEFQWRSRMGSSFSNSGGTVIGTDRIIRHPNFSTLRLENDFAIVRLSSSITFSTNIQPGAFAGPNYFPADNEEAWAIGWGLTCWETGCSASPQLRHVQVWTINQEICRQRYAELNYAITDSMLCSGWLDVGGRDQCSGDSGGPLLHNGVVVGICSWGEECALPRYPGVNARVSVASNWIVANA